MRSVVFGILLILGIWFFFYGTGIANPQILPSPAETMIRLFTLMSTGDLNPDILASAKRWGLGFIIGILVGAPIGLAMGHFKWIRELLSFPTDFIRSLPVTALFPVFLLAFGIQDTSKIAMVATTVAFVMIVTASYGVRQASRTRQQMAYVFGASPLKRFVDVALPDAVGQIVSGMRVSLGTSLAVAIVAEMFIGARTGLGQRLYDAYSINSVSDMYAVLVLVGIIGYALNLTFIFLESRIVFWVGK